MFFAIISLGQTTEITLQDGTTIIAKVYEKTKGITIEKGDKKAEVTFDPINKGKKKYILRDINDLDVTNVEYSGDEELISELRSAMQEQFESQKENEDDRYQEALTTFEQAYFPDGVTSTKEWDYNSIINCIPFRKTLDAQGKNIVTGRNAFSPYINTDINKEGKEKYELSLFKGKFLNLGSSASAPKCKGAIEITDLQKEEVMELVKQMLSMTNEEVLQQYKPDIDDDRIIMALLIDDEIQRYFESAGVKVTEVGYGTSADIVSYTTDNGRKIRIVDESNMPDENGAVNNNRLHIILSDNDEIQIDLDNDSRFAKDGQISSMVVENIQENPSVDDELHKRIVSLLQSRFINKGANIKVPQQDVLNLITAKGRRELTQQAQQQIINTAEQGKETKENKGVNK